MGKNKAGIILGAGILIALLVSVFTYSLLQKNRACCGRSH